MRLRRYAVTVMDHWTPMRYFWTERGAFDFYMRFPFYSHMYKWENSAWIKLRGSL